MATRGADHVGGEGFEVGEIEGQREQCHHEGEEEQGAGKIFEAANDIGGKRDAKTRRAVVTQKFLGRTVRADMVAIEWIASGERDEERGAGEKHEAGRGGPRDTGAHPADEEFLREQIAGDEADVEDERDLVRTLPPVAPFGFAKRHESGRREDHQQAVVARGKAERHARGEFVATELEPGLHALRDDHARHGRAGDALESAASRSSAAAASQVRPFHFFKNRRSSAMSVM